MTDSLNNIGTALIKLTEAFGEQMIVPTVVELASWEQGNNLVSILDKEHLLYLELGIHSQSGEMCNQCVIAGIIVRWPAKKKAVLGRDGRSSWKYI